MSSDDYVLAELYPHQDSQSRLASNKATLFLWWSCGFGPLAIWWMQKEVVFPLPVDDNDNKMPPTYSIRATHGACCFNHLALLG